MFRQNEGKLDRIVRIIVAVILLPIAYFMATGTLSIVLYILAAILAVTAMTGFCGLYTFFGINTVKREKPENPAPESQK